MRAFQYSKGNESNWSWKARIVCEIDWSSQLVYCSIYYYDLQLHIMFNQFWHARISAETGISNTVDRVGFEPTTFRLPGDSSTTELSIRWYHVNGLGALQPIEVPYHFSFIHVISPDQCAKWSGPSHHLIHSYVTPANYISSVNNTK